MLRSGLLVAQTSTDLLRGLRPSPAFLALPSEETVFWSLVAVLAAVVVFGAIGLVIAMMYFLRSISGNLAQLRAVLDEHAAQGPVVQGRTAEEAPGSGGGAVSAGQPPEDDRPEPDSGRSGSTGA